MEKKFRELIELAIASVEGINRTGLRVVELKERYAKVVMPFDGNGNHVGTMYAGSLFSLGEFSGGVIFLVSFDYNKFFPIVKEVSIRFRRPAYTDVAMEVSMSAEEAARIEKEAQEKGKADFTLDLELKDDQGEVVSLATGIWQMRKMP